MNTLSLKNRLALHQRNQCPSCGASHFSASPRLRGESFDFAASDVDLLYALKMPPEKAIEYFQSKGYAFSWDWRDVWQEAQSRAFTVAKAMKMDVLQTIRDEVQKTLNEGTTLAQFRKNLEPQLKSLGWWGKHEIVDADGVVSSVQLGSPWRLRTIYNTNLQTSYLAGKYKTFTENVDDRPYWMYETMRDPHVRPSHAALRGLVFRYDDPFWQTHYPPNDWG